MALTEQVILDIQQAERQINALESQLDGLSQPIPVDLEVDSGSFDDIARALGVSEEQARELTEQVSSSVREASLLDANLREIAQGLGLSEREAAEFAREMQRAEGAAEDTGDEIESTARRGTSAFRTLAATIGGVIAALGLRRLFSSIVEAGFARFTTIEDSTRALTIQLGSAADAAALLGDVLDVVRGTPFNLDQFASAAQQLAGFGVEIERIPGILAAIGEAAATQGDRAPEFVERLVDVFGQITTTGRIATDDLNRIASTGVNALVILANAFGVTTEEMQRMVTAGAVPAGDAIDALATGIVEGSDGIAGATVAMGGTMEGLRETLSGARGGLRAALARLGEAFFQITGATTVEGLNQLAAAIDRITASVQNLDVDTEGLLRIVTGLPSAIGTTFTQISSGGQAVGNAIQIFNDLITLDFSGVGQNFRELGEDIQSFQAAPVANQAIQNLLTTIQGGAEPVAALESVLAELSQSVSRLTPEQFEGLLDTLIGITEASGADAFGVVRVLEELIEVGRDLGFSAAGIEIAEQALKNLFEVPDGDQFIREIEEIKRITRDGIIDDEGIDGDILALETFSQDAQAAVREVATELRTAFASLPDELDAAAAALRDSENEIVDDIDTFFANLEAEIEAREEFRANIRSLELLGLDDLAQVFRDAGLEAAGALADAVADPTTAAEAERALDEAATRQANEYVQAFRLEVGTSNLLEGFEVPITPVVQELVIPPQLLEGIDIPGNVVVNQTFTDPTTPTTSTAQAAQSTNAITHNLIE